jgi:hypothetical protein
MRKIATTVILGLMVTTAASAQERTGYVKADAGFATSTDATSRAMNAELGKSVSRFVLVFGEFGRLSNLQPSAVQPTVDATVTNLQSAGYSVLGAAKTPAWYSAGGIRIAAPTGVIRPYATTAVGFARVNSTTTFTYQSGTTLTGADATVGEDATSDVMSNGYFTTPSATTDFLIRFGGGVQIPLAKTVAADVSYNLSRIWAATPVTTNGLNFGVVVRF